MYFLNRLNWQVQMNLSLNFPRDFEKIVRKLITFDFLSQQDDTQDVIKWDSAYQKSWKRTLSEVLNIFLEVIRITST